MRLADHIVDIGPGAGVHGGQITAQGTPAQIIVNADSLTGAYLSGKIKIPYCPNHHIPLMAQTISQMADQVLELPLDTKIMILAPVVHERKGEHVELLKDLERKGFIRARIDGEVVELANPPKLDLRRKHNIEVIVDRIKINPDQRLRLSESLETASQLADGIVNVGCIDAPQKK